MVERIVPQSGRCSGGPAGKLRPFGWRKTAACLRLMDTHQTNPDQAQAGEQPFAAEVQAPAGGEQPRFDAQNAIATLDPAILMEMLENEVNPATPQPAVKPAPPAGEQPPGDDGDPNDAGTNKPRARLSVRALPEAQQTRLAAAIDLVRKGESPDIEAAFLSLSGAAAQVVPSDPGAAADAAPVTPPAAAMPAPEVAEIQDRLTDLRAQRLQMALEYNKPEEIRLTEEIEAANMDLFRAEQSAATRQVIARDYQSGFVVAVEAVEAKYPECLDDSTPFSRILDDKVAAAKARNDPALANPNYLIGFADEVAEMLGQQAAPAAMPRPPARASRPVGSSLAPGQGLSRSMTLQDARNLVQSASIEDLQAALYTE